LSYQGGLDTARGTLRRRRRWLCAAGLLWLLLSPPGSAQPALRQVYLVQNSGWMEPFFVDPQSAFRPLVESLVQATASAGEEVILASFNQDGQLPDRPSPFVVYQGPYEPAAVTEAVAAIDLPRRPDGRFTDGDLFGALTGAITGLLESQPGIIWMVTNNKNAPDNDPNVQDNTRRFSNALGESAHISHLIALPVRMPVTGAHFRERGLIIYGIAYGEPAAPALERIARAEALRAVFSDPPVRLKRLDEEPLSFRPTRLASAGINASMADGRLVFSGLDASAGSSIELHGRLVSEYYPYVIHKAVTSLEWDRLEGFPEGAKVACRVAPAELSQVPPHGAVEDVALTIEVPPLPRPPGLDGLFVDEIRVDGQLRLGLDQVALEFDPGFTDKIEELFGLDQLLPVFFGHRTVATAATLIPVALHVRFSRAPLMLLVGAIILGLLALALVVWLLTRSRRYAGMVNGRQFNVRLRPLASHELRAYDGTALVRLQGRPVGKPRVEPLQENVTIEIY